LHPLVDDLPCPVLQYADDTLIIIRAVPEHVANLKNVLDSFSAATGLVINFHKSTFVPIKTDQETALAMAHAFGCAVSSFPQIYLGLPLSLPISPGPPTSPPSFRKVTCVSLGGEADACPLEAV
jgi:hypothetical protein